MATFDLPIRESNLLTFESLDNELIKLLGEKAVRLHDAMLSSVSMSITSLSQQIDIDKPLAKYVVQLLVRSKAYIKFHHYWRRTEEFYKWLIERSHK